MEAHYPLEVVISALKYCNNDSNGFTCMKICPYVKMKDCLEALHTDALYYIRERPEVFYVVLRSLSKNNNIDTEVFGIYENEKDASKLVNKLNDINEERYWYQKISQK